MALSKSGDYSTSTFSLSDQHPNSSSTPSRNTNHRPNSGEHKHQHASDPSNQSKDGLAILCSNCCSTVGKTPLPLSNSTMTHASPIYNSPFYTFAAATSTTSSAASEPVPPRILQILGFTPADPEHQITSSVDDGANIPIVNSPEDMPASGSGTVAILSRLRAAIMGSTGTGGGPVAY